MKKVKATASIEPSERVVLIADQIDAESVKVSTYHPSGSDVVKREINTSVVSNNLPVGLSYEQFCSAVAYTEELSAAMVLADGDSLLESINFSDKDELVHISSYLELGNGFRIKSHASYDADKRDTKYENGVHMFLRNPVAIANPGSYVTATRYIENRLESALAKICSE